MAETWLLAPALWGIAYLIGSIPSGLVISRISGGTDVRSHGSGNIGTANVYRVAGRGAAALTLLFDALKGCLPILLGRSLGLPLWALLLGGGAAVVGHNWSLYLRGRGGKGIATSLGAIATLAPVVTLIAILVWLVVLLGSRYASLASLLMMASLPALLAAQGYGHPYLLFGCGLVALALYRHRTNIARLWSGTELKITAGPAGRGR